MSQVNGKEDKYQSSSQWNIHQFYESCDSDEEEDEEKAWTSWRTGCGQLVCPGQWRKWPWGWKWSEDQRNKNSNKKLTQAHVDTNVGALNKRGTISKVIKTTIRVFVVRVASKEGGGRGDTFQVYCWLLRLGPCSVQLCGQSESVSPTSSLLSRRSSSCQLSGSFRQRK